MKAAWVETSIPAEGRRRRGRRAVAYVPTTRDRVKAARKPATVMRPANSWAVSKASGIMVSASMARIAPGGHRHHERDGAGAGLGEDRVADERRHAGGRRDAAPDRRRCSLGAPGPAHAGRAGEPLRQVGEKHRRHGDQAHPLARQEAHADHDGFRNAVEQRAERDGQSAPLLVAMGLARIVRVAGALAVLCAPARHEDVRPRIDRGAREEPERGERMPPVR